MPIDLDRRTFLATVAAFCLSGVRANSAENLTGIWSAAVRTRGGLGSQMIFTPTEATSTFGALIDIKYEIDGTKVRFDHGTTPPPGGHAGIEFTIEGDKLTLAQGFDGRPLVMTRVGASHPGAHPIVGDWTYMHPTGVPAVQRFSRNGTMQLTVAAQILRGPYLIENDTMTVQFEGRPPVTARIKREGNALTITNPDGRAIRYLKFEY